MEFAIDTMYFNNINITVILMSNELRKGYRGSPSGQPLVQKNVRQLSLNREKMSSSNIFGGAAGCFSKLRSLMGFKKSMSM